MTNKMQTSDAHEMTFGSKDEAVVSIACAIGAGAKHVLEDLFGKARDIGVPEADLLAVVSKAMCVKNSARDATNKEAYRNLDVAVEITDCCSDDEVSMLKETAAIASAVGTSCLLNFHKHVRIGSESGLSSEQIARIIEHAFTIKADLLEDFEYLVEHPSEAALLSEETPGTEPCCDPASDSGCC